MLFVGIDWSDSILDYHMRNADGDVLVQGQVAPSVDGLTEMFMKLEAHALPGEIGIAIETSHGTWVQALLDRGYCVYPVNPKSVDSYRQTFLLQTIFLLKLFNILTIHHPYARYPE